MRLPEILKNYSPKVQRQYVYVFNTVYPKVLKETNNTIEARDRAIKASNSVLKKRFTGKETNWDKNDTDYVNHLIDKFLGNLEG